MKAMVLCAGEGKRLQPVASSVPKPLVSIVNRPILSFILDHLKSQGVDEVAINTAHKSEKIEAYLGDGNERGLKISYSYEGKVVAGKTSARPIGSAGGMKRIQDRSGFFDDTFIVLCGDAIVDLDIGELVRFHKESGSIATVAALDVAAEDVSKHVVIVSDHDGSVRSFQTGPSPVSALSTLANAGIYIFEPEIFDYIPSAMEFDIDTELLPKLIELGLPIFVKKCQFNWVDVNNVEDFVAASISVVEGASPFMKVPGEEIKPGIHVGSNVLVGSALTMMEGPIYIGAGTTIKAGAVIKGAAVIGDNCVIEAGTYLENVILNPYTHIRSGSQMIDHTVYEDWVIPTGAPPEKIADTRFSSVIGDVREQPECVFQESEGGNEPAVAKFGLLTA